jgi:hypothetical protein
MNEHKVEMTPYIANSLIHGWATEQNIKEAKEVYNFIKIHIANSEGAEQECSIQR